MPPRRRRRRGRSWQDEPLMAGFLDRDRLRADHPLIARVRRRALICGFPESVRRVSLRSFGGTHPQSSETWSTCDISSSRASSCWPVAPRYRGAGSSRSAAPRCRTLRRQVVRGWRGCDHSFERGMDNVTATYTARDDGGIGRPNRRLRAGQGRVGKSAQGRAIVRGRARPRQPQASASFGASTAAASACHRPSIPTTSCHCCSGHVAQSTVWILARQPDSAARRRGNPRTLEAGRRRRVRLQTPVP